MKAFAANSAPPEPMAVPVRRKSGVELIAEERGRQITDEGWDASHDDEHTMGELAAAAMCYAELGIDEEITAIGGSEEFAQEWWPWEQEWWKPSPDRIKNLTRAAALLAAEIDRLQRKETA
jgi:hypothetical protein